MLLGDNSSRKFKSAHMAEIKPLNESARVPDNDGELSNPTSSSAANEKDAGVTAFYSPITKNECEIVDVPSLSRETLVQNAAQLIEGINEKRKQNTQMISEYKKSQIAVVEKACAGMESHLIVTYNTYEPQVQEKLQQLFDTFGRIEQLEQELKQFRQALSNLCKDMLLV